MSTIITTKPKPFVKWVGGKRQIMEKLRIRLPESYSEYYEPFVGGGALLFGLQPEKATINDLNSELINTYKVIKNSVNELIGQLAIHDNREEYFYTLRAIQPEELSEIERAARFIFLNKTCFNGLWRVNKKGEFNAPFGRYKNPNYRDEDTLRAVSDYLNKAEVDILCDDFDKAVENAQGGDFIYFDPPYQPISTTANFTSYHKRGFNEYDQVRLAETFRRLDSIGCYVMLSNSDTSFIKELYKDFTIDIVSAKRAINCKGNGRSGAKEVIIRNYQRR